jgi:inner membrane protease subunit 2
MPFPRPIRYIKSLIPPQQRLFAAGTLWILGVVITVNDHVLELTPITGNSMAPTLSPAYHATGVRDVLAWSKYRPAQDLQRGDIVMYEKPFNPEGSGVKRVIALGGDTVVLDRRRRPGTDVDGQPKASERTAMKGWDAMAPRVKVPYGHVWVEGDNWRESLDSNYYGPLSKSLIVGKAMGCVWPPERWGRPWDGEGKEKEAWGRTTVIEGVERVPEAWADLVEGTGG